MPHIKPHVLHPQHGTGYHASFLGISDDTIDANDLVVPSGYSGDRVKWRRAAADTATKRLGVVGIADHAATSGQTVRIVSHKLITGVASAATEGSPIYMSDTLGEWTINAGATTVDVVVGTILTNHASTGAVLLAPAHCVGVEG